ncbi:MAG: hypothetical protein WC099_01540 [Candidatus Paceibacterota bacterium]
MKFIVIAILIAAIIIGGTIFLIQKSSPSSPQVPLDTVSMVDGKQIITITAKGGYSPRTSVARADIPAILRVITRGTFDCSSALTIPSIGYKKNLPPSGTTDIDLLPQKAGTTLRGLCSMGMYTFSVDFQ